MPGGAPDSEFSEQFVSFMKNRMALSFYKYGPVARAFPSKVDAIQTLKLHLEKYEESGNTELLVDLANYAMIEFMHPRHPHAHFQARDSDGSQGRAWSDGSVSQKANPKPFNYTKDGD
jgi:hypothetical protein